MNRYKANSPLAAVTAMVLSVLISATSLMAYTNVSVADLSQAGRSAQVRIA